MQPGQEKEAVHPILRGFLGRAGRAGRDVALKKERAPKFFRMATSEKAAPNKAWQGLKEQGAGGTESVVAFLPMMAAEKLLGKSRVREGLWKYVHGPALKADTYAGHMLGKIPGTKKLFTETDKVPWGKKNHFKEIERSSALAPLTKIRDVGAPIIVGVGLEKGLGKAIDLSKGSKDSPMNQELREKVASTMLSLHAENKEHTKRAHATRLLFKKAELGLEHVPQTFGELQEKVAELMTQDLVVMEKALELAGGQLKLGELDSAVAADPRNATEKFQAAILGDEI